MLHRHKRPLSLHRLAQGVEIESAIRPDGKPLCILGRAQDAIVLHRAHQARFGLRVVQGQRRTPRSRRW